MAEEALDNPKRKQLSSWTRRLLESKDRGKTSIDPPIIEDRNDWILSSFAEEAAAEIATTTTPQLFEDEIRKHNIEITKYKELVTRLDLELKQSRLTCEGLLGEVAKWKMSQSNLNMNRSDISTQTEEPYCHPLSFSPSSDITTVQEPTPSETPFNSTKLINPNKVGEDTSDEVQSLKTIDEVKTVIDESNHQVQVGNKGLANTETNGIETSTSIQTELNPDFSRDSSMSLNGDMDENSNSIRLDQDKIIGNNQPLSSPSPPPLIPNSYCSLNAKNKIKNGSIAKVTGLGKGYRQINRSKVKIVEYIDNEGRYPGRYKVMFENGIFAKIKPRNLIEIKDKLAALSFVDIKIDENASNESSSLKEVRAWIEEVRRDSNTSTASNKATKRHKDSNEANDGDDDDDDGDDREHQGNVFKKSKQSAPGQTNFDDDIFLTHQKKGPELDDDGEVHEKEENNDKFTNIMADGTAVLILNLSKASNLNGSLGTILSFNSNEGRYKVLFNDGTCGKLKPKNLYLAGV